MEIIEKKRTKEITETFTYYKATDGTEFHDQQQCEKYEQSAAAVLLSKLTDCELSRGEDMEWLDTCDENEYRILSPRTQEHIDALNQLWFMHGGKNKEARFTKEDIGKVILMGVRIYGEGLDWAWFYNLNNVVNTITKGKFCLASSIVTV